MTAPERSRPLVRTARRGRPDPRTPNGNAPFGSRRPGVRDRVFSAALRPTAAVWWLVGLRHSAATARHYYGRSGTRLVVDPEGPLATAPFRKVADRHLEEWRDLAVARWRRSRGAEREFDTTTNWHGVRIGKGDDLDWWLALRGLQYRITGRLDIDPGEHTAQEDARVRVVYEVEIYKDWGFDKGEDEYGLSFTPLARLHEAGLAREYAVVGRSRPLVWTAPTEKGTHGTTGTPAAARS
ncbi:hypothetical protein LO772_22970 [Yinghuangia sp. ASG 101]|uniref:hypothetical protein n=1 Tax=Yinghuangia sp. ASG 101 TaxID=2896848 RepID=UPI001E402DA1|nr:hypothetical protein [Yinghuangia sp. ASG 101]UGQ09758.1 hypothetical protein LO772_22970 [Yinghuangia sp. ASG 101]